MNLKRLTRGPVLWIVLAVAMFWIAASIMTTASVQAIDTSAGVPPPVPASRMMITIAAATPAMMAGKANFRARAQSGLPASQLSMNGSPSPMRLAMNNPVAAKIP